VTRIEEFEELRPLLFSIAYRMLGSVAEAEDAVQETWLRYEASPTEPRSAKAFLSAVVSRISTSSGTLVPWGTPGRSSARQTRSVGPQTDPHEPTFTDCLPCGL
jgi:Sigma-70 region 2